MSFEFTDADSSPYEPGKLFLGYSDSGREVGIHSERHFLTVAGSGAGKGSSLIIPNLLRWPHNALVIDPGGGNARATWEEREEMGQTVHVIDPARVSGVPDKAFPGVPDRLQRSFNPLALLDPTSRTYGEDLGVIADGLVMRHDSRHARWDNGGRDILAGIIDFALSTGGPEAHSLPAVRNLLLAPPERLTQMFEAMASPECNAPSRAAAALALADLANDSELIGNATENTQWLDYRSMAETLSHSNCNLTDIKTKPCTIFLVIDPNYMDEHSRFLRLFVRSALGAMAKGGETGEQCLFILDEFFSLGKIDYVQKSSGLMRKNGVQLWPILQDLNQLTLLYGPHGSGTFFSNADAHIFFGVDQDKASLDLISERLGNLTADEIGSPPTLWGGEAGAASDANARLRYEHAMKKAGHPRLTTQEIAQLVGKGQGEKVARSMIVFGSGGDVLRLRLAPYFLPAPPPRKGFTPSPFMREIADLLEGPWILIAAGVFCVVFWSLIAALGYGQPDLLALIVTVVVALPALWLFREVIKRSG